MNRGSYLLHSLDGELYHYGVLGMKWGIRKEIRSTAKSERSNSKKADKYRNSGDYENALKYEIQADRSRKANSDAKKALEYTKKNGAKATKKLLSSMNDYTNQVNSYYKNNKEDADIANTKAELVFAKYNKTLKAKGLAGSKEIMDKTIKSKDLSKQYAKIYNDAEIEAGKEFCSIAEKKLGLKKGSFD